MANMRHDCQNVSAIDATIRSIKKGAFHMATWDTCICGHVLWSSGRYNFLEAPNAAEARRILGISLEQARQLFCTNLGATKTEAIKVLEILRDEGVVDWFRVRGKPDPADEFDRLLDEARAMSLTTVWRGEAGRLSFERA